ncbi:DUF1565 domain-containing protein [Synechococcus sp. PCC 6312]|uniref:DUF1565 domain-containing protein n=1 Tax=Synechococcus sp. (strain ATCC 27167 / PCC 6312) TaxID=195253 RepID=UPI00029EC637|nr:DUF1565 domain-containing protein [Synechococcus sp. PCC 6312]AFY60434.1 Protein of unknown function (DUF1565) [Synechococcus sp. PCC 6312]
MVVKQVRNAIFAGLSGAVVIMAFANNLHDVAQRWWPNPFQDSLSPDTNPHLNAIAQAADTPPNPNLLDRLQALTSTPTFYVAADGTDQSDGTANAPFPTLSQAITAVTAAQAKEPQAQFIIQLAAGTYGDANTSEPLLIPPGVTLKGQGTATTVKQSLQLSHNSRVEQLVLNETGILIRPQENATGEVSVEQVSITRGFLTIKAAGPLPTPKIQVKHVTMADSCILVSGVAKPEIRDVQMRGNVGVDDFSLAHCSENGLLASGDTMPLIQLLGAATLENILVSNTNLAIFNQSEGSVIKNLRIVNSLNGIENRGNLSLDGPNLENVSYTGICNHGSLTLQRPGFDPTTAITTPQCLVPGLDQPPPSPINLAGNLDTIKVN